MATLITALHFLWVLFMLAGFFWTLAAFFVHRRFFDYFWFRTLHAAGILFVSLYAVLDQYCPLTIFENYFRQKSGRAYSGGFISHYVEKLVYPDVNPIFIKIGTFTVVIVTIGAYLILPPRRVKDWAARIFN